jgi:septal ring factor EnvC (AmiA/AmiB activator)
MSRDRFDIFMETMSDWADAHRQALSKVDTTLATLAEQQSQLTAKVDKLSDKIETLAMVVQSQQVTAQQQSENIALLIQHAANLAAKN